MLPKKRMIFGVVIAEANRIEQKPFLEGIIQQATEYGADVAVISNLYNANVTDDELFCENMIYDLINSPCYDGIIFISDSFINLELIQIIKLYLSEKEAPIIVIGKHNPEFNFPNAKFIDTSYENDIMDITNHMIEEHGYKDIAFLTGHRDSLESQPRIEGYRKSLESHGIIYDERKVFYGNFQIDSGKELARKYISGKLQFPEAIVCANDCMAYGLLDEFDKNGINVSQKIAVIGYENIYERSLHYPLLTTYQINKKILGKSAVQIIYEKIKNNADITFTSPKGTIIHGLSCGCDTSTIHVYQEIKNERIKKKYDLLTVYAPMEQQLTKCGTLDEFIKVLGLYTYLIRNVQNIYLCLYENWYELENQTKTENMTRRSIMSWSDPSTFQMKKYNFHEIFDRNENPAAYYFNPIFFNDIALGYIVLKYDNTDSYDDNFRNILKSISNALVFLSMKNDIHYLTRCQNLSESMDSLTALNNNKGLGKAFRSFKAHNNTRNTFFVMMKICLFSDYFSDSNKKQKISSLLDAADAIRQFCDNRSSICGRIDDTVFGCFIQSDHTSCEQLIDNLNAILTQHKTYLKNYGMDSFICCAVQAMENDTYSQICKRCASELEVLIAAASEMRNMPHYNKMLKIRNDIYINRHISNPTEEICQRYSYSPGYLRSTYKKCFNISFHKDYINSRISMAKYLLCTTNMTVTAIAEQCGYDENKHFMHQFKQLTGITPNMYRSINIT